MSCLTDKEIQKLYKISCQIRQDIIKMLLAAGSGHSAGPLGFADVLTALYFGGVLKYDPKKPQWPDRDRLILSNGHECPVLYAVLARAGFFPVSELKTLRKLGSRLQGHPHRNSPPGIENSSGPVAHGAGMAVGMAIAAKADNKKYQVYCLVGDGEQDEGMTWEAAAMAGKYKLDNLTFIMDRNNIQIDGYTENVMPKEPLKTKYEACGWQVLEINGHDIRQIVEACEEAKAIYQKPVMIIANTIPGKGVDFMEYEFKWHGASPNQEQAAEALRQLRSLGGRIVPESE
jgi:transketolase